TSHTPIHRVCSQLQVRPDRIAGRERHAAVWPQILLGTQAHGLEQLLTVPARGRPVDRLPRDPRPGRRERPWPPPTSTPFGTPRWASSSSIGTGRPTPDSVN